MNSLKYGDTPLHATPSPDMATVLIKHGANVNAVDTVRLLGTRSLLADASFFLISVLFKSGATPLYSATDLVDMEMVLAHLQNGTNPDIATIVR